MRRSPALRHALLSAAIACIAWCVHSAAGEGDSTPTINGSPFTVPLPGAMPPDAELVRKLQVAWSARPAGYTPRTRHRRADGTPQYTNRLFLETSPYLRQHAHNPVSWYPWGDEAFATAQRLGRPVLLSVGYSTCHWCHVMEEESFEDEDIARYLNEHYVAVKVDREQRPDIDAVYMSAVQALTGGGGWPMTVWLTPDRQPFYGGTYFPPRDGGRGAGPGFLTLLQKIAATYTAQPQLATESATQLAQLVRGRLVPPPGSSVLPGPEVLEAAAAEARQNFDPENGGTRRAPKFPSDLPLRFLLRYHRRSGDRPSLDMVATTLEKMAAGGIHDHVGGGFHRYAVDSRWLVPHFEKMLYDNALLTLAYLEAYQATGHDELARVAREILRYVERDMTSPGGAFYSATDADSVGPNGIREEGRFFTWTPAEIAEVIGPDRAHVAEAYYDVYAGGNFAGRSILHTPRPLEAVAIDLHLPPEQMRTIIATVNDQLYVARARRPQPLRDEKILTAWNGLMISAYARASLVFGDAALAARGARAGQFVLTHLRVDGRLRRSFTDGRAEHAAYLDDYAFLIAGLLDLYEATGEAQWLREATGLDAVLQQHFEDTVAGGYFMTGDDHERLFVRAKPVEDRAEPSGNSVQALNLLRLYELTTAESYRTRAEKLLQASAELLRRAPLSAAEMLLALDFRLDVPKEIVIITAGARADADPLLTVLRSAFVPNRIVSVLRESDVAAQAALVPLVEGKLTQHGKATAYVCEKHVCRLPTTDPAVFRQQVTTALPLGARAQTPTTSP